MDFARVSHFSALTVWIFQEFRIFRLYLYGFCKSFAFFSSTSMDFARVSHFSALPVWVLQEFRIFQLYLYGFCKGFAFFSSACMALAGVLHFEALLIYGYFASYLHTNISIKRYSLAKRHCTAIRLAHA